jgi:3-hydroxybutyryl-CoA dehydrogenase
MAIERVGVVGAGQMGGGIAEVCARAGFHVLVSDVDTAALDRGREAMTRSLDRAVERGKAEAAEREEALARIDMTTDLGDMADRQLVIEAAVEDPDIKSAIFRELDGIVSDDDAILASNTSSIPIISLAVATDRPASVLGVHFFNPPPVMKLVEIIPSLLTSEATLSTVADFVAAIGKQSVHAKDQAGFIVNALLTPILVDAIRMYETGVATAEDIDKAMVLGVNHPMGPLALADLIGIDTVLAVAESLYEEFRDPKYVAPPLLRRMVAAGRLGRKTGRGFYDYSGG